MMLYLLVPKVGEHNMETVREIEKMGKVRGEERIERVRRIEEAIREIR